MIDTIDPAKLPAIPFAGRATLPEIAAVYFALGDNGEVLYIGAAHNLRDRWLGHHRLLDLEEARCARIAWLACDYAESAFIEATMIAHHKPLLNGRGRVGRPLGKRSSPHFERMTVLVKKQTRKAAQRLWEDVEPGRDMSELIEQLMTDWITQQVA